jgi:dTDP-4-amino-4,6-dideoxygalactose transaminase
VTCGDPFNLPQQDLLHNGHLLGQALERMREAGQVILGEGVTAFERSFATWLAGAAPAPAVVGVANGTDALELALRGCEVQAGDTVLLPSHTAYATLAAVLRLGAVPRFVDIAADSATLDLGHLETLLEAPGPKPKALIAVHLYGEACPLAPLADLCERHGLDLIEDCAQACGTVYRQRPVGLWGRFAAFSFYPTNNLAAFGDGGALVINRPEDERKARRSRFYGWNEQRRAVQFGVNSRLDELQAWVLHDKLPDLAAQIEGRRQLVQAYQQQLHPLQAEGLVLPADGPDWRHSYHLYVIQLPAPLRTALLEQARQEGIPLGIHYREACHQQPYAIERFGPFPPLPRTEARLPRILSLPLHPYLQPEQVEAVCHGLHRAFERAEAAGVLA